MPACRPVGGRDPTPWTRLASTVWIDDPWLTVRTDRARTASGAVVDPFHVARFPDWAAVVGVTAEDRLLMVRVYRHPVESVLLEFPAGGIDAGETPEAAARRELREETGFAAGALIALPPMHPSTGRASGTAWPFLAVDVRPEGPPDLEESEDLEIVTCDLVEVLDWYAHAPTPVAGVHFAMLSCAAIRILADRGKRLEALRTRLAAYFANGGATG
ncbi:MAG: NUDIX hydrolase [Alphaproteobacteria bacterium]|nr:NUDIX hydrolase [Alphaproteobacteria bacterium]